MVRELRNRCDLCPNEAEHVGLRLALGPKAKARHFDLCEIHYKELIQPVVEVLNTQWKTWAGDQRRQSPVWRKVGPFACLVEGCSATPLKNRTTFVTHLQRVHDLPLAEYVKTYGEPAPLTPEEVAEIVVTVECEVEGCGKVYSTALGNRWPQQAMIHHMSGRHGIKWRP